MKDYTVVISYSNGGVVCEYLYTGINITMLSAINNAILEFQQFMKESKTAVEILEVNAWIRSDPVEDCLKVFNDDDYYEITRHIG